MKNLLISLLAFAIINFNFINALAADDKIYDKVPVEYWNSAIQITLPIVVDDEWMIISALTSREMPGPKPGELTPYSVKVYYPSDWGRASVQHHFLSRELGSGLYTLTFVRHDRENDPSVSFTLDLRYPLSNMDQPQQEKILPDLIKAFGPTATNLSFAPPRWLVEWHSTAKQTLNDMAKGGYNKDNTFSAGKIVLPPQINGKPPFTIEKVGQHWEVFNPRDTKKLITLAEITPYLESLMDLSLIRVQEGFLKKRLDVQEADVVKQRYFWFLIKNETAFKYLPSKGYYIAYKKD